MKIPMYKPGTCLFKRVDGSFWIDALKAQGWLVYDEGNPPATDAMGIFAAPKEAIAEASETQQPVARKRGRPKKVQP